MPSTCRASALSLVLLALLLLVPPVAAQDTTDDATDETTAEEETGAEEREGILDEITVTAQKRVENVQEVPVSITTFSQEELELITAGGQDVRFLSSRVPSLIVESSFGRAFPRFYIRGLGNTDFDLNASQPVSMVYDEIVLENPILKGMPVWDIEQTEVLRGPQGTLFGRNTPAGIVKFDSVRPAQESDRFVRLSYGTYETTDVEAAFGGGLTETVSGRVSLLYQGRSDWIDNRFTGENDALGDYATSAARVQFLFEPSDDFEALLNLHAWDVDGSARIFRANILRPGTNDLVAGFEQDEVAQDGLNSQEIEAHGANLKLEWDLGSAILTSVTGFETLEMLSRGDIDGGFGAVFAPPFGPGFIPFPSETADGIPDLDQTTQEIRLASQPDENESWDWLVGLFYFDESLQIDTFSFDSLAGNVQNGYAFQSQDTESVAVFASLGYRPAERWNLEAGLRFTNDEKDFAAERPQPIFQTPTDGPITRTTDADNLSWDLSATYEATDEVNVYGRLATGFRAPSIQGRILFCPDFAFGNDPAQDCVSVADEEEILSAELGVKSELMDRRLRLNATGYVYEVDGQQIVAVGGQFNTATLLNSEETEGYGFETDLELAPNPEWFVKLGVSYNHTEIQDEDLAVAPCGGGCTILDPIGPNGVLVDGNSLPHAPEWIVNGIVDYRKPVGDGIFMGSLDWAYHDEKRFFLYESAEFRDDAFELGLRLAYTWKSYELALFGRNLTDEINVKNGIDFNNLTGMTNDPRLVGAELVIRF